MKNRLLTYLFMILMAWSGLSCQSEEQTETQENQKAQKTSNNLTQVRTAIAQKKPFSYFIHSTGKIQAKQQALLRFRMAGNLAKVYLKNGQRVRKNQLIAELVRDELLLNQQKAAVAVKTQEANYNGMLLEFGGEWGNAQALSDTLQQVLLAKSGLEAAKIQQKEADLRLEFASLKAPFAGKIADITAKAGNFVQQNDDFCMLYTEELEVEVNVLEVELSRLKLGQKASVSPLASSETYQASLTEINPRVNEQGLVRIKLSIQKPKNLWVGMNTSVRLEIPQRESITVPKEAVVIRSGKAVVFSLENGLAKWNYVKTGLENGKEVEILEGLTESMEVIVSNNLQLAHDAPIEVLK